jgi:holo-[acyl-carrier protein] synthase
MKILGHGIDMASASRLRQAVGEEGSHFERRVFSASEIAYCRGKKDPFPHFAARFAAKEAYGKALGLGLGPSGDLSEIEVAHGPKGAPELRLSGRALEFFRASGGHETHLSLSHEGDLAIASVIVSGKLSEKA